MKKRAITFWSEHRELVKILLGAILLGGLYYLLVRLTPVRIPCVFHALTGLYCPGCGISRFFVELAQLHFLSAVRQNLAVAILLPLWSLVGIVEFVWNPPALAKGSKLTSVLLWTSLVFLLAFGVLRNIPCFFWLQPVGPGL